MAVHVVRVDGHALDGGSLASLLWANVPVLVSADVTAAWQSRVEWVRADGQLDLDLLERLFGDAVVDVAVCDQRSYSDQQRRSTQLREYIQYLREKAAGRSRETLYLKDWHIMRDYPLCGAYTVPPPFRNDWLNSYWDNVEGRRDDYRFCYIGPDGSWTPLHADVFLSYSWSANVTGVKIWTLFPPSAVPLMQNARGELPYDIRQVDTAAFPRFHEAPRVVVVQQPGECLFVPSGWYHQVHNQGMTLSINHNWGNEANLYAMWRQLRADMERVRRELDDCRGADDWPAQCQLLLRAHNGMDYADFARYLLHGCDLRGIEAVWLQPPPADRGVVIERVRGAAAEGGVPLDTALRDAAAAEVARVLAEFLPEARDTAAQPLLERLVPQSRPTA